MRSHQIDQVKVVRGDVRDRELLERTLGEYEIDTVFHLAAQTIVTIANRNPLSTFETNIAGTWNMLEACRRSPTVKQIVVASSDKAYGDQEVLPYDEATPLQGVHPYDVSKSGADLIARTYAVSYGLPVTITRCGNFYGGGDLNWNRIVPGTIRSILRGQRPVIRSDGDYVRDYFYVEDGAAAYMLLAEKLAEQPDLRGEGFNFSYGNPGDGARSGPADPVADGISPRAGDPRRGHQRDPPAVPERRESPADAGLVAALHPRTGARSDHRLVQGVSGDGAPGSMTSDNDLRAEILKLVADYHRERFGDSPFRPGVDAVHYAGRVFDAQEMQALVDSAWTSSSPPDATPISSKPSSPSTSGWRLPIWSIPARPPTWSP